ncbi:sterol desaturase family protein [Wenyingzhuangia sp. IMCC45467]
MDHVFSNQFLVYASVLVVFWVLELVLDKKNVKIKLLHSLLNVKFLLFVLPIQILFSLGIFTIASWTEAYNWGLLHFLPFKMSFLPSFIVAFIILDFFEYVYHRMMHRVPFFWRFHQVHHSDRDLDITTTVREHPGETVVRLVYTVLMILIVGVSPAILIIRQFIQSAINLISHITLKLPENVNNIVSVLFVTPNTHQVHHHYELPYTDSNYGDVLSVWDRIFSTFMKKDASKIIYGVDVNMDKEKCNDFKNLLKSPFDKELELNKNTE